MHLKRSKNESAPLIWSHSLFRNALQHQRKQQVLWISSYVCIFFYFFSDVPLFRGLSSCVWVEPELIEDSVLTPWPSPGTPASVCYMQKGFRGLLVCLLTVTSLCFCAYTVNCFCSLTGGAFCWQCQGHGLDFFETVQNHRCLKHNVKIFILQNKRQNEKNKKHNFFNAVQAGW